MDAYGDYLKIAIRVQGNFDRPINFLMKVEKENNLPEFLKRLIEGWVYDLKLLKKQKVFSKVGIPEARRLIDYGKKRMIFARDRIGLVPYTTASAILHRLVDQENMSKVLLSETYYLLGVTESLIARSFWVSQSKSFFETSIRVAPHSAFAPKAYALLEEQAYLEFTGSSGMNVPDELKSWLTELRELINRKGKKKS